MQQPLEDDEGIGVAQMQLPSDEMDLAIFREDAVAVVLDLPRQ